jgi:hypothetical protein
MAHNFMCSNYLANIFESQNLLYLGKATSVYFFFNLLQNTVNTRQYLIIQCNFVLGREKQTCFVTISAGFALTSSSQEYSASEDVGRAVAQAVTRWLLTSATRVRARSGHVGFVVDKVSLGQLFSEHFDLP